MLAMRGAFLEAAREAFQDHVQNSCAERVFDRDEMGINIPFSK
jgi:hypothetical protein